MFRKIKYSDQYLAKTLFKRALLFIFLLINVLCGVWYLSIFQSLMESKFSWWDMAPIGLSIIITTFFGWGLYGFGCRAEA